MRNDEAVNLEMLLLGELRVLPGMKLQRNAQDTVGLGNIHQIP